jgi:hypothetical protein
VAPGEHTHDLIQLRRPHPAEQAAQSVLEGPGQARQVRDRLRKVFRRRHTRPGPVAEAKPTPGENTGKQTMAESEAAVQCYGWRCLTLGASIMGSTLLVVLVFRENLRDASPPFVSFCVIMSSVALGAVFLSAGIIERLNRYGRTMDRANTLLLERMAKEQRLQGRLLRTDVELTGQLAHKVEQLERIVEKAPGYGEAFVAGMTVARGVTDEGDRN